MIPLPIDEVLPHLSLALQQHPCALLSAPPGSGKTTRVAPHLLQSLDFLQSARASLRVHLLQPRRVAARATAERIAQERAWTLGERVGYQVRFDSKVQRQTPLVVSTEGILLRRIQNDPILEDVGVVILDEFHERTMTMDLLLGMLRRIQTTVRPDLRILVMSATLATDALQAYLDQAPLIQASGQLYPVETIYRPAPPRTHWIDHAVETIVLTAERTPGDILVFLPGVGEIYRIEQALRGAKLNRWSIHPLHGSLPLEEQNRALWQGNQPRIVLATNVAETSLTLEGIRTVIDTGMVRVMRFDPSVGLDRLELEPICQASAEQRSGRAGRTQAGQCIRLWDASATTARPAYLEPEIRRVDVAGTLLQLYQWGEGDGAAFPWFQAPRPEAVEAANRLLARLHAIDRNEITEVGKAMSYLPVSPRLARLLIEGHRLNCLREVALVAAMLSERDPFVSNASRTPPTRQANRWDSDVCERMRALEGYLREGQESSPFGTIHRAAARTIADVANQLYDDTQDELRSGPAPLPCSVGKEPSDVDEAIMRCLLAAFPDRLAKRRLPQQARGLMVGGKGVVIGPQSGVLDAELFLCIDVDASGTEASVRQASAVQEAWLPNEFLSIRDELFFHPTQKQVVARRRRYWDDLMLSETPVAIEDESAAQKVLYDSASQAWEQVFPADNPQLSNLCQRVECLRDWVPELQIPALDRDALKEVLWDLCRGRRSFLELKQAPWLDWIRTRFTSPQWQAIEKDVPERIVVPSGSSIRLEYSFGKPPILAVRIQEVFSWKETPRIAMGRVPLLLHLLAPNMRPQQITDDLKSFWENTYPIVRKELKRRYPKHAWPEDPWTAAPVKKGH